MMFRRCSRSATIGRDVVEKIGIASVAKLGLYRGEAIWNDFLVYKQVEGCSVKAGGKCLTSSALYFIVVQTFFTGVLNFISEVATILLITVYISIAIIMFTTTP